MRKQAEVIASTFYEAMYSGQSWSALPKKNSMKAMMLHAAETRGSEASVNAGLSNLHFFLRRPRRIERQHVRSFLFQYRMMPEAQQ